jgi:Curlin associated repeat
MSQQHPRPRWQRDDARRPSHLRLLAVLVGVLASVGSTSIWSADLSMLSDFGRPDIALSRLGLTPVANSVGVEQTGHAHTLSVDQSGTNNNSQLWQSGAEQQATIRQEGADNEFRLLQSDGRSLLDIQQSGSGNQIAITQSGLDNTVRGIQVGIDNELVLIQSGNSQFSFTQQGDRNQMLVDMPTGLSIHVDQVGNEMKFELQSAP